MTEYYISGVKGLKGYMDALRIIPKDNKSKYYHKQHAVSFVADSETDISNLIEELAEKGLVLKTAGVLE